MADQSSDQTIRQMMAGFSAMQFNLGLLPMQTSQSMAGAQYQAPPPPPQMPHPSEAAMAAMAHQNSMIQQTLQAAQVTRYQPPPSAPMPSVGAMGGFSAMNPFAAGSFGGGASSGGGFAGGGAYASPAPRLPSIFNPFAPTLPTAHFASPAMRSYQMMQAQHSQVMGTMGGIGEGVLGLGGSMLGGMLGSTLGPLGTLGGAFIGGRAGHAMANMIFNPVTQDFSRGRQIQAMSSPFMVSGPNLNSMTGQGFDAQSSRQIATGLRHMQRDYDFERTGFNSQDTMRIMQMSANQGLLTGAQSPDQIVQKVKEISKTVKVLMRITGDPDVRDAIASLGQMRDLGFQGLGAQAGAVANRAMFARMSGMSQSAMHQVGMAGADLAGQFGLGGATGFSAGMSGAALANMSASSGALNDLQLARAGGRAGLGQISAMGQLSSMQDERYLLAAMGRDSKGRMTVDMDAYRKAQTMSFDEVTRRSADALREMGAKGIFEWNTRKQEFKDQIAQKLTPLEMNLNMFRQAGAFMKEVPGMTMGTAIQSITGMSAEQARALELQGQSRSYWDAQVQQLRAQRREAADQDRAHREQFRTPGLGTRMRRGVRNFLGDVSDTLSSPFRSIGEHFERVREDDDAADRGERISRYSSVAVAHDAGERRMLSAALGRRDFQTAFGRANQSFLDEGDGSLSSAFGRSGRREMNRIGSFLGLSSSSDENRLVSIASRSQGSVFGMHPFASFGDTQAAMSRVQGVVQAASAADNMDALNSDKASALASRVSGAGKGNGSAVLSSTTRAVMGRLKDMKAGLITSATAISGSDIKDAYIKAATTTGGMTHAQAQASWAKDQSSIMSYVAQDVYATGDKKLIEPWEKAKDLATDAGAVNLTRGRDAVESDIKDKLRMSGLGNVGDETLTKMKSVIANHDEDTIALATAIRNRSSSSDSARAGAEKVIADAQSKYGAQFEKKRLEAQALSKSFDARTAEGFGQMLKGTAGFEGMSKTVGIAKSALGERMALGATNEALQRMDDMQKGLGSAGTVDAAIAAMRDDTVDKLSQADQELVKRAKKGDTSARDQLISKWAPTSAQSRHGGGTGAGVTAIDKQIADIETLRDQVASGDADSPQVQAASSQLDAASTQLFAGAVKEFTAAVGDLKGHSESNALSSASPIWQSFIGGK